MFTRFLSIFCLRLLIVNSIFGCCLYGANWSTRKSFGDYQPLPLTIECWIIFPAMLLSAVVFSQNY